MIAVMGATGQVGRGITERLLAGGEAVRALGRSEARLAELARLGARTCAGDAADEAYLSQAFEGARAVFTLLPYDPSLLDYHAQQDRLGESIVRALGSAGVPYVVALSSVGADLRSGTGFIASLFAQEQRLSRLPGTQVLVLRPGSFFENFHAALPSILEHGVYADAFAPDVPIPMIATRDISAVGARALMARNWEGFVVRELLGPRDLSYADATRILGECIGKPELEYVRLPDNEIERILVDAGFSEDAARLHVELAGALSDGTIRAREERSPDNTTPTTFEEFAGGLARPEASSLGAGS